MTTQQPADRKRTVLFLCTGNYYRSRFAEHYFNHAAEKRGLPWRAESRGLSLYFGNEGGISQDTLRCLEEHGIDVPDSHREPLACQDADLEAADLVIAIKEAEHRPLLARKHPAWPDRVEYWHVHDIDYAHPEAALPELRDLVEELLQRLSHRAIS